LDRRRTGGQTEVRDGLRERWRGGEIVNEFERVVLTRDAPEEGLVAGDVGTVVHVYGEGEGFEVEFLTPSGRTVAVATLDARDVREAGEKEVLHVRAI
jgi:hypothetical protein